MVCLRINKHIQDEERTKMKVSISDSIKCEYLLQKFSNSRLLQFLLIYLIIIICLYFLINPLLKIKRIKDG